MGAEHDLPTFDGDNGITCEALIRAVRQYSLIKGKEKDDYWIAITAATCLDGSALRWYECQDHQTQENWKLLRRAILIQWSVLDAVQLPSVLETQFHILAHAATSPIPAPSPPSFLPQISSARVLSTGSTSRGSLRTGRIRVISEVASAGQISTFMANKVNPRGFYGTTGSMADALVVQFSSSKQPHDIFLKNEQLKRVGVLWIFGGSGGSEKEIEDRFLNPKPYSLNGALTPMSRGSSGLQLAVRADFQGIPCTAIWNVMIDGTIIALWQTPMGALYPADIAVAHHEGYDDDGVIQLSNSFQPLGSEKRVQYKDYSFEQVGLAFEEI